MKQAADLILIPQYFGSIIYDRKSCRYGAFDSDATNLFANSIAAPARAFIDTLIDRHKIDAALRFFKSYKEIGYFDDDGMFSGRVLQASPSSDHLTGPLTVHLEVTAECNLKCVHCFASESKNKQILSLKELESLFKELASLGSYRLGITGGEPLLRRDIFDIIDAAVGHGLQPCMTSNGLLITEDTARELGKRNFGWFNISLDGATARTNDAVRGKGTYDEVLNRISILKKYKTFSLAFTVMKHNMNELAQYCELAKSLGAQAAVFRPLYPVGNASKHRELMPDFSDYLLCLNELKRINMEVEIDFYSFHAWGPGTRHDKQATVYDNFGCGAGNTTCSISSNGDVLPCSFLGQEYIAGNLRATTFKQIWDSSPVFKSMRNLSGNAQCETCNQYDICSGGCRARALLMNNSINDVDPWCIAHRQETRNEFANAKKEC